MNLQALEAHRPPCYLTGIALLSGFYLNELLVRLLPRFDMHANLFTTYHNTLQCLQGEFDSRHLRYFEKQLLAELGYGITLDKDANTGEAIDADASYYFLPQRGFMKKAVGLAGPVFSGQSLLSFHHNFLVTQEDMRTAKQITRLAIAGLLGGKSLKSRELLVLF
jgi:DNA repair protein RecO (recombination protein O)